MTIEKRLDIVSSEAFCYDVFDFDFDRGCVIEIYFNPDSICERGQFVKNVIDADLIVLAERESGGNTNAFFEYIMDKCDCYLYDVEEDSLESCEFLLEACKCFKMEYEETYFTMKQWIDFAHNVKGAWKNII